MSKELFEEAKQYIPGGVNSPVRAFGSVGGAPVFISRADGPYLYDSEGKQYIDHVCSWGPMILGHNHPAVRQAVVEAAGKGTSYGACTQAETQLARLICQIFPSVEKVRLVNSGTEATMSALRLARGATGRDLMIKFRGCYHGHGDSFLIEAGSGALTFGQPSSPGVTQGSAKDTLLADYNDLPSVEALFSEYQNKIACLIVEPVAGNMGVIPPAEGFLQGLRSLCTRHGALLIFDEVITGFRLGISGAQGRFGVTPDLTTLGKIIGGGLPIGAYGGRADIMDQLSPIGPVYQAGTLSGNPLATAAGIAVITQLMEPGLYDTLESNAAKWQAGLEGAFKESGIPYCLNRVGTMMTLFFNPGPVSSYGEAVKSDTAQYARWFHAMLSQGVYLAPSQFEAAFISTAHTHEVMENANEAVTEALKTLKI
jgi:glutamate-1-semialdehyde 2,1-aminomutase